MKKSEPAATPDDYVESLTGWHANVVAMLRAQSLAAAEGVDEKIKWGHLVYFAVGPAFMIRAEDDRVLFGFWRGKRLLDIEPRLKPGGKYELANLDLREGMTIATTTVRKLTKQAVALNHSVGNPTKASKKDQRTA